MTSRVGIIAWTALTIALATSGLIASTSSAFTLPDISIALGGTYPIHAEGSLPTARTELGTAGGSVLAGKGASLLTLGNELSSLGPFSGTFLNVEKGAVKCNSEGDAAGVVLVSGSAHAVLGPGGTKKFGFSLFLVATFIVHCGAVEVEVSGDVLGAANSPGETETEELTTTLGTLEGTKGKQKFTEYFNDGGTIVKAKLLSEAGAGETESDLNVEGALLMTTLEGKMATVTGR